MAGFVLLQRSLVRRALSIVNRRLVSTSKKSNETAVTEAVKNESQKVEHKNWISYGFDSRSKEADRNAMHSITFAAVTLCLVLGGYFLAYVPDYHLKDWATREAFLELQRREQAGGPLVDPNLIDPAKIQLPTDEELEGVEIII